MTFRFPWQMIAIGVTVFLAPSIALIAYLCLRYPEAVSARLLSVLIGYRLPALAIPLLFLLIRVPVVADADGVTFAWFFRMRWSDVTAARTRTMLGFRVLEISRRNGLTWRPLLRMYDGLPDFLARHAPESNPLRLLRDGSDVDEQA